MKTDTIQILLQDMRAKVLVILIKVLYMNKRDLRVIVEEGESYNIEFKENVDKKLAKELVAFSNSFGGEISSYHLT